MRARIMRKLSARIIKQLSPVVGGAASGVGGPSPVVCEDPGKLADRGYIAARGTRWERVAFHQLASRIKQRALSERRRLGAQYLEAHADGPDAGRVSIDRVTGLGAANLADVPVVRA